VAIGCAVGMFVSLGYMVSGITYRDDAINIYNDDLEQSPNQWGPPGRWGTKPTNDQPASVTSMGSDRSRK
jgi:hypothetical protein